MSYDALGVSDAMLDSLSLQLREAEARRAEAERAHQEALAQLRGMSSGIGRGCSEPIETLQSRARELEKKDNRILAELEHPRTTGSTLPSSSIITSGISGMVSSTIGGMPSSIMTSMAGAGALSGLTGTTGLTGTSGLAGTTGLVGLTGIPGVTSVTGLTGTGCVPGGIGNISNITGTGTAGTVTGIPGIGANSMGITSSISSHAITSIDTSAFGGAGTTTTTDKVLSGTTGVHVSPLPGRAHPMTTMPPLSQV
ncbi:unnamed protein product [Hermetia illucens]|uniref:Uncharacterized protein n=1 Tax=Hermetia illucens TaxID=343691 RepID=A0A7R8Z486_HERIL|nr:unnamed protein product [Hermetia illucens]